MPKPYKPTMPVTWWLKKPVYFLYMMRELTSVFIAAYSFILLLGLSRLAEGPEAWQAYLELLKAPWCVAFHVVALLFALLHTVTFLNLTPMVVVIPLGEERVPAWAVVLGHYGAWIAVSAILVWLVLRG